MVTTLYTVMSVRLTMENCTIPQHSFVFNTLFLSECT
jgi:hypothetical protein